MITNNIDLSTKTDDEVMALFRELDEILTAKSKMLELEKLQWRDEYSDWLLNPKYSGKSNSAERISNMFNEKFNKAIIKYVTAVPNTPKTMEELEEF